MTSKADDMTSEADNQTRLAWPGAVATSGPADLRDKLLAGGGMVGAVGASLCCLVPLALFTVGISGAWIGYLTGLSPYQPYFLVIAIGSLSVGGWLRHRSNKRGCAAGEVCARPLPSRTVTIGFIFAMTLIVLALGLQFLGPLFL